jgi:hypothetical protein
MVEMSPSIRAEVGQSDDEAATLVIGITALDLSFKGSVMSSPVICVSSRATIRHPLKINSPENKHKEIRKTILLFMALGFKLFKGYFPIKIYCS